MFREESQYSLVVHIARSICLRPNWAELPMLMLTGYYDRGGEGGEDGMTVVAGYVSSVEHWAGFDAAWRAYLARPEYDVPYFHMKEFAHSKRAYAVGWSRQHTKRREFLSGLIEIIQAHAFRGFASAVQNKVFKELCSDPDVLAHYPNEYVYCGRSVVGKARLWARSEGFKLPMQSVFECGDYGWGALVKTLRRDGHPEPIRKPKKPTNKQDEQDVLTPLQAGDFAAYEILKFYRIARLGADADWDDVRESFWALNKYPPCEWDIVSADNVSGFLENVRFLKESARYLK